jgi:hypothetical protein
MRRNITMGLLFGLIVYGTAFAETYGEKIKEVDVKAKTLTFTIAATGTEKTLSFDESVIVRKQQKVGKRVMLVEQKEGIKALAKDDQVVITSSAKDGKEVITEVLIETVSAGTTPKKTPKKKKDKDE